MSMHVTRRGGTPSRPEREPREGRDHRRDDARAGQRDFESDRAARSDAPPSPLVRERQDPDVRAPASIGDCAARTPGAAESDRRSTVFTAGGLAIGAGAWLVIAPFVLPDTGGDPVWNDVVVGGAIALLAITRVAGVDRAEWLSWSVVVAGAWVFASVLWLDTTTTAAVNDMVAGALVTVFGTTSAMATHDARRGDILAPRL